MINNYSSDKENINVKGDYYNLECKNNLNKIYYNE